MHAILSFSTRRYAIIARLNVIYTKFRRAMITQLNKIWRVRACARTIARHSRPGLKGVTLLNKQHCYYNYALLKLVRQLLFRICKNSVMENFYYASNLQYQKLK